MKKINLWTEANKVDKVIISYLVKLWLSNNDFDTNFTISWKDRPDVAIKDKFWKYCIIFENKKDFKDLSWAKNQGLKYLEQLKNLWLLSPNILLIRTNMSTFHADEYEIIDEKIVWKKDITNIDILEDIKIDLIKSYTHPEKKEEEKLLNTDKQELKRTFEKINNYLRDSWLDISLRLHITSAMLFLKLIKENWDLFENIKYKEKEKNKLKNSLSNLENNITETNITDVFLAINEVYSSEFRFDLEKYNWVLSTKFVDKDWSVRNPDEDKKEIPDTMLIGLYKIVNTTHLSNYDLDVKWEAFEYFINYWNTWSDMWEYFTPRHIVRFMVRLVDETLQYHREKLSSKTFFDPTCWTGWFLIEIFKEVKEELKRTNSLNDENFDKLKKTTIFWNELNLRSSEIAKMNMILTWDWHSNIRQWDFISYISSILNKFDVSIWNPPFWNNREWEFVDGFLKCVNVWWFSIILVPEWVLFKADKNFVEIRKHLLNKWKLLKVISLPQWAFLPYTWVKTNIIFWKNELQDKDYDIEFIDIKNDWFSLDANRKKLQNSDLDEYFKNKQDLIDKWQIWTVNSGRIYDKTKLNELELSKSKLELEEKEQKNKIETLKKQLKQIDDNTEKEQKEKRILELQSSFDELKKQIKKINDKLKTFDINLVVNRYKIQKEINKNIEYALFWDLVEYLPKSKRNASDWQETWKYPFFTSSEIQNKYIDKADYIEECLIIWDGWKANINISKDFSANSHNFIIQAIPWKTINKYLYLLLKYNLDILEAWFNGAWIKNISKDYINNIQMPLVSLEYQQEIIKQIEKYEKVINWAKQVIENLNLEIEINKNWEIVELWDYVDMISWFAFESKDFVDTWIQVVKIWNVKQGFFDKENNPSYLPINFKEQFSSFLLKKDDILISMTWTVWKTDYWNVCLVDWWEYLLNQRVWKIQTMWNKLMSKFLYYISFNAIFKEQLFTFSTWWIRQANISNNQIKQIKIPLPSLEEQKEIVERIEKEQALINANKEIIKIFDEKIRTIIQKVWSWE